MGHSVLDLHFLPLAENGKVFGYQGMVQGFRGMNLEGIGRPRSRHNQCPAVWQWAYIIFWEGTERMADFLANGDPVCAADRFIQDEVVFPARHEDRAELFPQVDAPFDPARMDPKGKPFFICRPKFEPAPGGMDALACIVLDMDLAEDISALPHRPVEIEVELEEVGGELLGCGIYGFQFGGWG